MKLSDELPANCVLAWMDPYRRKAERRVPAKARTINQALAYGAKEVWEAARLASAAWDRTMDTVLGIYPEGRVEKDAHLARATVRMRDGKIIHIRVDGVEGDYRLKHPPYRLVDVEDERTDGAKPWEVER